MWCWPSAFVAPNQYNKDGYINCRIESDNPVTASKRNVFLAGIICVRLWGNGQERAQLRHCCGRNEWSLRKVLLGSGSHGGGKGRGKGASFYVMKKAWGRYPLSSGP